MTIEKFVKGRLFENGLWEDECDVIFDELKKVDTTSNIRWSDDIGGYPPVLKSALIYGARQVAIEWLKENKPEHIALFILEDSLT